MASAVGAPLVIPGAALGADGAAPSERLAMGFIGIGGMGGGHLSGIATRREVQILALCDVRQTRRQWARKAVEQSYASREGSRTSAQGVAEYGDFRELLARSDIDAVLIATPDHWHAITSIAAAKAGKDVFCEKPLSLTIGEGRAMVKAMRRYGRVFQTGSMQRSSPEFRFACEMVRSGRIGQVKTVEVYVGGPSQDCYLPEEPVPKEIDWDMWLGPAPWRPYHSSICSLHTPSGWRNYRDYAGGGMTDWGAHHFDIAQWGLGMDDSGPVEMVPPNGKDIPWLTYKYANGVTMTHGGPGSYSKIEGRRTGNDGVVFNGTEGKIEVTRGYLRTWPESLMETPTRPDEVHLYKSSSHFDNFLQSIRTRQKPICDVEIGCRSVTVCHLGNITYWLNRPLKWDPVKERFIGDAEANRWIDRPKRDPWTLS